MDLIGSVLAGFMLIIFLLGMVWLAFTFPWLLVFPVGGIILWILFYVTEDRNYKLPPGL